MDHTDPKQLTVWLTRAIAYVAYAYLVITEIILVQGFLLLLFGANTGSSYVDWAYRSLDRVMSPFRGIFESIDLNGSSVLDTSIIFAMVIYGILALLVNSLLDWLTHRLDKLERDRMLDDARERAATTEAYSAPAYTAPAPAPQASPYPDAPTPPASGSAPPPAAPQH